MRAHTKQPAQDDSQPEFYEIASGLLVRDWPWVVFFYLLTSSVPVLAEIFPPANLKQMALLNIGERFLHLLVLVLICGRTIRSASTSGRFPRAKDAVNVLAAGMFFYVAFILPLGISSFFPDLRALFAAFSLIVPVALLSYAYFFYFFPFLAGNASWLRAFPQARIYTRENPLLPLKVCLAPAGIMLLFQALLAVPYPDLRNAYFSCASAFVSGVFWFLSTYLALAAALIHTPEKQWHDFGLSPYRQSWLTTLRIQSVDWVARFLKPSNGAQILGIGILIWAGNFARLGSLPPGPRLSVSSTHIEAEKVTVTLDAVDALYRFRGFHPAQFALAGPQRTNIASAPRNIFVDNDLQRDMRLFFPRGQTSMRIILVFQPNRPPIELTKMDDVYIWYAGYRALKLDLGMTAPR